MGRGHTEMGGDAEETQKQTNKSRVRAVIRQEAGYTTDGV